MDGCLRCSGRTVPYGGGGVTPVTLTPNFEFPISAGGLFEKTMTASSPVTADDLVNGLVFYSGETPWNIVHNQGLNRYEISDGVDLLNSVEVSQDGLTISFGSFTGGGPTFDRFTFNE